MADYTLQSNERGIYEVPLEAGQTITVAIDSATIAGQIQVMSHSGVAPIYVGRGEDVAPGDENAIMIPPSTWADVNLPTGTSTTLSIVSAQPATVSVYRA